MASHPGAVGVAVPKPEILVQKRVVLTAMLMFKVFHDKRAMNLRVWQGLLLGGLIHTYSPVEGNMLLVLSSTLPFLPALTPCALGVFM